MANFISFLPRKIKLLLTVAVSFVLILSFIALASGEIGSGPVIGSISPTSGTNVAVANPTISFVATDPDKINQASIQIKLNGNILPFRVTYPEIGRWVEYMDSCSGTLQSYWVIDGYDYTKATITATTTTVPDQNSVTVNISDQLGNSSSSQWNFTAMFNPQIKVLSPLNGINTGPKPFISATITDNGTVDPQSVILKIGTEQVIPSYDMAAGKVAYTPINPLPVGKNDIYLTAKDISGNQAVASWSVNVSSDILGPALTDFSPVADSDVKASSTQLTFNASDPDKIDTNSVKVMVNGKSVPFNVTLATTGRWVQYWDSCSGSMVEYWVVDVTDSTKATVTALISNLPDTNNVSVSVADQIGNISTAEWKFTSMMPPVISEMTPGNGKSTSDTLTKISAKVSDLGTIDTNSVIMTLDGSEVSHNYAAINESSGTVSYTPPNQLTVGTHQVFLVVKDTAGNSKTQSWTFNIVAGIAVFSGELPAVDATVYTSSPTISINVTDVSDLSQGTLKVTVNGKPVTASINFKQIGHMVQQYDSCSGQSYEEWVLEGYDYKNGTVTAQVSGLTDGKASVSLTIGNITGISTSRFWTFDVKVPPSITQSAPAANSSIQTLTPVISARVTDNGSIASVKMTVNGAVVPAAYDAATSSVKYTPTTPLTNDKDHNVVVTVIDNTGASVSLSWKFHTQIYSDMQAVGACTNCHLGFPEPNHPMSNCYGCHSGGPVGDCADCHGGGEHSAGFLYYMSCEMCHNATYSYKIPVHPANITTYHNTTANMDSCGECHQTSLTIEHSRYKDAAGNSFTCYTCHLSSKPTVQQALAKKLTNCDACHDQMNHETVHADSVLDEKCTSCHINSLTKEHLTNKVTQKNTLTCDTCHNNTNKAVSKAISSLDKNCAACHQKGHNIIFGEKLPLDIPLFNGFNWTVPEDVKMWSGEAWVPVEYLDGGKVSMSSRRSNVTMTQIWSYYKDKMSANGWTLISNAPADGDFAFTATFTKESRRASVLVYGGANPGENSPVDEGYRITIIYK